MENKQSKQKNLNKTQKKASVANKQPKKVLAKGQETAVKQNTKAKGQPKSQAKSTKQQGQTSPPNPSVQAKKGSFFASLNKGINIFMDIILYPLLVISVLTSVISITARDNKELKSFLGHSVVTILSGSMEKGGFDVGDVVFLKTAPAESLRPLAFEQDDDQQVVNQGDIIAFYRYTTGAPSKSSLTLIQQFDQFPQASTNQSLFAPDIKARALAAKAEVVFHRIINVYMAADGTIFFETKGDNNNTADGLIHQDLVVGKYIKAPAFITGALTFMITPAGMLWAIIVPLAVIVFFQIIELTTIIFDMGTEKKVLEGSLPFDSEESIKAKVGTEMSELNKIYFYDISPPEDKDRVKVFLWDNLEKGRLTKKEIKKREEVDQSVKLYNQSRDKYWDFWLSQQKNNSAKHKLKKLQRNADIITKARQLNIK